LRDFFDGTDASLSVIIRVLPKLNFPRFIIDPYTE
jgi:hypothetical protein